VIKPQGGQIRASGNFGPNGRIGGNMNPAYVQYGDNQMNNINNVKYDVG
jgi:hypothetical protein